MPTTQERHALLFLAVVAGLGAGVRTWSEWRFTRDLAGAAPVADAHDPITGADAALARQLAAVDSARRAAPARPRRRTMRADGPPAPSSARPLDVDVATAAELERLPRIGPALAARIVAVRDSLGGFGSMEALRHVRGIGPATAAQLESLVTFSSWHRPYSGAGPGSRAVRPRPAR